MPAAGADELGGVVDDGLEAGVVAQLFLAARRGAGDGPTGAGGSCSGPQGGGAAPLAAGRAPESWRGGIVHPGGPQ